MSRYYNDYLQHSDEDTLAHFGVPGMKWGQRKNRYTRSDARLHGKIQRYIDNTDLDTLTDKQKKNLAGAYVYFEAKKHGIEVPKMHRDLKWALNNRFSSRKEVVAKSAAAGGAIVGGLLGTYMGHTMKNAQRENQEDLPYVE